MKIISTRLSDVLLLEPNLISTELGEDTSWSDQDLSIIGIKSKFVQNNQSRSAKNVLRGLHYQIQHPQGKLISVLSGAIFDVVVDLRRSSPNFLKFVGFSLNSESRDMLWIPPGYAHGFYVTSDYADVYYSVTDYRYAEHERTLLWSDPALGIDWPIQGSAPILSDKDATAVTINDAAFFD